MYQELENRVQSMYSLLVEQERKSYKGCITITVAQAVDIEQMLVELINLISKQNKNK